MHDAPDLLLVLRDFGFVSIKNKLPVVEPRTEIAGTHHPDGVFLAYGPGISKGATIARRNITDVCATLLYSLGLAVPSDFEGKVPQAMFTAEQLERASGRDRCVDRGRGQERRRRRAWARTRRRRSWPSCSCSATWSSRVPSALVNGVRLNYVQMAAPDIGGPHEDLVMVHGLATNLAFWYFHYAAVFARRYRVTVYDLRGHGRSEMTAGGYTPANLARDLEGAARPSGDPARALPGAQLRRRDRAEPGARSRRSESPAWCSPTPTSRRPAALPGRSGTTAPACSTCWTTQT